ncbi:Uncharacterised protein [Mycobacteroides abscessus subsp. abscessus]|uniref:hypothetical protein n=1 Tax=Mycobacteroides abscessus TaxID=36809 RepID=UPI000927AA5B|nr:hypothetical protein [Mycobacteroides abscessus]SHP79797.1 Uncharacterised protein [Mycobacteroides abscessus subsp. bolletii]SHS08986.1 Uncharacterised protein [Mycobacteroides abscessus subsp. bolletii]SHS95103.1 Uncharacterised protein [Mycobacteroides abscessus subsp. bolletii]SKF66522.1 Uncharacterised protein [Mycobacteroides abscessus subsp. bolletii]SKG22649.1 Uncharacterised protein [Mycobacteroides abscessus subsp. bolletii]
MQLLTSALPGFRNLRAPITAGYLWLILLWLAFKPNISSRPTNDTAGAVYDLAKAAGPIWIGLGIGMIAYLIGCISQTLSPLLKNIIENTWKDLAKYYSDRSRDRYGRSQRQFMPKIFADYQRDPVEKYEAEAQVKLYDAAVKDPKTGEPEDDGYSAVPNMQASLARILIMREIELPATVLLGKEPHLFSEADRLKAESEFRLAIAPPLTGIIIFLYERQSAWWIIGIIAVLILLVQSHARNLEYRYLMLGAIQKGAIESEGLEWMKRWVDSIPDPSPPPDDQPTPTT